MSAKCLNKIRKQQQIKVQELFNVHYSNHKVINKNQKPNINAETLITTPLIPEISAYAAIQAHLVIKLLFCYLALIIDSLALGKLASRKL